jgi:hypothetical protein
VNHHLKKKIVCCSKQNEENGANGAKQYKLNREAEMPYVLWAFESDGGVFGPIGIGFTGSDGTRYCRNNKKKSW